MLEAQDLNVVEMYPMKCSRETHSICELEGFIVMESTRTDQIMA